MVRLTARMPSIPRFCARPNDGSTEAAPPVLPGCDLSLRILFPNPLSFGFHAFSKDTVDRRLIARPLSPQPVQRVHVRPQANRHYSREMRDQSQAFDIVHNYANGLFDEVFCNEISGPGVWWPGPISGSPMNYSG